EEAEKVAAQTLKDVKEAMRINYFDDEELIARHIAKYQG
ncbi:MAG: tryptophan--tRNA ligase, partial [Clostridiales bacterium]|nr:tryptophan--tRNA ligase [Clostridiales bacterium]